MAFLTPDQQKKIITGMESLVSLAEKLSSSRENPGGHEEIWECAQRAHKEIKAVNEQLEEQQHAMDSQSVVLMDKRSHLNNEKSQRELSQKLLQIQLEHHEKSKKHAIDLHSTVEKHLKGFTKLQKKVSTDEKWYNIARTIALLFMPLSTLMAGIVAAIFQTSLNTAQRANQELQIAINHYETKVSKYLENVRKCDIKEEEIKTMIKTDKERIDEINKDILELLKIQGKRKMQWETFLCNVGLLVGDLETLEKKLENDSDYDSAWEILEKIMAKRLEEDRQLLDTEEIRDPVMNLKKIIQSRTGI